MAFTANEWLWDVYQHTRTASRESLHSYFRGQTRKNDLTADIMNMVNSAVRVVFPADSSDNSSQCNLSPDSTEEWIVDKMQCAIHLYCLVAEHLLQQLFPPQQPLLPGTGESAVKRFKGLIKATYNHECYEMMRCPEFHKPLIECALHVVAFITEDTSRHYPLATQLLQRASCAPTLWWAARSFQECFSSSSGFLMPYEVVQHLQQVQLQLLDQPVWALGSLMYNIIERGGGGGVWKDSDPGLVEEVLGAYAHQAVHRAQMIGWLLQQQQQQHQIQQDMTQPQPSQQQSLPDSFHDQCAWLMDQLLQRHLNVVFGQHMAVVAACVVYVTAKLAQVNITFKRITEATLTCVSGCSADVFQHAEVQPALDAKFAQYGDIRMFYNTRFLPAIEPHVRQYMQQYQQQATAAARDATTSCLSPKSSPALSGTPGLTSRRPLAGLPLNALTQGAAAGQLPRKAASRTKGWTAAAVVEDYMTSNDVVMQDAGGCDSGARNSTPCKAAGCVTPSRLMR